MKSLGPTRYALTIGATAALLTGCGGSHLPIGAPAETPIANTSRPVAVPEARGYKLLHSFAGAQDGEHPEAGLTNVNGTLYGTTYDGGPNSLGTVFAIAPSGTVSLVYSFNGGPKDGALPEAGVVNIKGTLYGTTEEGGANGIGAVYKVTTSGHETVLHNFKGHSKDGSFPVAGLTNINGALYGTTLHGGNAGCRITGPTSGCGTVFSITRSGAETVLYSFAGGAKDGEYPEAGLVNVNGTLYGTTPFGGGTGCNVGCGTIFAVTTSGKETVLHRFGGSGDGAYPKAGLLNVNGTLYGTTHGGGSYGWGTVFKITPSGGESVLYSFKGGQDGAEPVAGLIYRNGTFYGTTYSAGIWRKERNGHGAIFAVSTSGTETVLYRFKDHRRDGADPQAGVIKLGGALYGTTNVGGTGGYGTVFSLRL